MGVAAGSTGFGGRWWALVLLFAACGGDPQPPTPAAAGAGEAPDPEPWAAAIEHFERRDHRHPPAPGGVLFVGSSSIRMWRSLADDMAPMQVVKRGFGGATTADVLRYADRIVLPYRPRTIVYYAGDNDIGRDAVAPGRVLDRFRRFVRRVEASGQHPDIHFVSIKPSPKRMKRWPMMRRANALVRRFTHSLSRLSFVDVARQMLGADGKPCPELYAKDGVHLSPKGYRLWARVIKPAVMAPVAGDPLFL